MRTIFTLVLFFISIYGIAQTGSHDLSFGTNGKVITPISAGNDIPYAIKVQQDGKILVAGSAIHTTDDIVLVRYNTNGSLDASFGTGGKVIVDYGGNEIINSMVLQPDGKIVLAGRYSSGTSYHMLAARFNPDGSLDPGFGGTGIAHYNLGQNSLATSMVQQANGKFVLAGIIEEPNPLMDIALLRLNADGTRDDGFGVSGLVQTNIGTLIDEANDIAIQPDGRLVIVGRVAGGTSGNPTDFLIVRYLSNGDLDPSFDGDGIVNTSILPGSSNAVEIANVVRIQPDGNIVVGGRTGNFSSQDFILVRYLPNGSIDPAFGIVRTQFTSPDSPEILEDLMIQPDGKILAAGNAINNGNPGWAFARYLPNGTLDNSFDDDGKLVYPINDVFPTNHLNTALALALWGNRIYAAGTSKSSPSNIEFTLMAFLNDINTPPTGPYTVNGSASSIAPLAQGQHCFMLTPSQLYTAGSVWSNTQLNLSQSFEITTRLYFGAQEGGADGLAFVLQRAGTTALGTAGGGLGYADIGGPSFIIEFDTYQTSMMGYNISDPIPDHLGFMSNGSASHNPSLGTVLTSPSSFSVNIEDGQWHDATFRWNVLTKTMSVTVLGQTYSYQGDIAANIFGGNPMVNWGFTASTGSPLVGIIPSEHMVCILSATANLQGRAVMNEDVITRLQPNPTRGIVELQFKEEVRGAAQIVITNSQGTVVERRNVQLGNQGQIVTLDLSKQPRGLYLARIITATGSHTQKIIVQ